MSRLFYHVCQDNAGNLLFDVSGTMRLAGTGTAATIYGDEALTIPIANPMTNHPSFASFKCFLGAGDYDFYLAKSGYTFETLTGVQGHGTMAQQDANAVAITGGTALNMTTLGTGRLNLEWTGAPATAIYVNDTVPLGSVGFQGMLSAGTGKYNIYCQGTAPNVFTGKVGMGALVNNGFQTTLHYDRAGGLNGLIIRQIGSDTGAQSSVVFASAGDTAVGTITTTGTTTAYNTASDARLKHAIAPLTGALDVVRALNPVSYLWKADGSRGHGLLAQEVADVVDGVSTGEKDAVDDEGNIAPMQIDYSKLVPWLVSAVKELTQQVEALTAQLAASV